MKSVIVPIINHEYKVVVCWGNLAQLRKELLDHYYNPDHVTKSFLKEQTDGRRGVTFREFRCYSVIWIDASLPVHECLGTLAHEAVHAVDYTFQAIQEEDYASSEFFAHSVGAVVRETLKAMKLFGQKAKK